MQLSDLRAWRHLNIPVHLLAGHTVTAGLRQLKLTLHATADVVDDCQERAAATRVITGTVPHIVDLVPSTEPPYTLVGICPHCRQDSPELTAVGDLLYELELAAEAVEKVAVLDRDATPTVTPTATLTVRAVEDVMKLRGELDIPKRWRSRPFWAQYQSLAGTALGDWWARSLPFWEDELVRWRRQWQQQLPGWGGPLHLVAPGTLIADRWSVPHDGTAAHLAVADCVGTVPAPVPANPPFALPVFAIPATIAVTTRPWVTLGPAVTGEELAMRLSAFTALLASNPDPSQDLIDALVAATA